MKLLVIGAGLAGAVTARTLVEKNDAIKIQIIDSRDHIGGNCHTSRDESTDVMVHQYGPHIFNTNNEKVWQYVNSFGEFMPFTNRVKAVTEKGVFSLPMNLLTINQFFGKTLTPDEAKEFVKTLSDDSTVEAKSFEDQALKFLGRDLYEAFFYGYTKKQWGCEPSELPASILKRLPMRFNYDDNYYNSKYQGIPKDGYSAIIEKILDHPNINVKLGTAYDKSMEADYDHTFYSGSIDSYFDYEKGRLSYRTVFFEKEEHEGDFQGNPVINYTSSKVPYTRIHEHKHFAPWENHEKTVVFTEYSKTTEKTDVPYYPVRLKNDMELLKEYLDLAIEERPVSFIGRLGTYRYLDMDQVIAESLSFAERLAEAKVEDWAKAEFRFGKDPFEPVTK